MSDSEMLKTAEAEVKRLEAELAATTAYQKLQLAKQVVELYRGTRPLEVTRGPRDEYKGFGAKIIERSDLTKAMRIERAARKFLNARGRRATASEMLEIMRLDGIEITGAEPVKALSAYLSNSKILNNVREFGGYGLVDWGNNKGPDLLTKTGA